MILKFNNDFNYDLTIWSNTTPSPFVLWCFKSITSSFIISLIFMSYLCVIIIISVVGKSPFVALGDESLSPLHPKEREHCRTSSNQGYNDHGIVIIIMTSCWLSGSYSHQVTLLESSSDGKHSEGEICCSEVPAWGRLNKNLQSIRDSIT